MKRLSLALATLALAVLPASSALADTFSFSFDTGFYSGSGTLTANEIGSTGVYNVSSITGTYDPAIGPDLSITGLSNYHGADNKVYDPGYYIAFFGPYQLDNDGLSFALSNGDKINLSLDGLLYDSTKKGIITTTVLTSFELTDTTTSAPAVPEPGTLALMGTGVLGLAGAVRRRLSA